MVLKLTISRNIVSSGIYLVALYAGALRFTCAIEYLLVNIHTKIFK